MAEKVRLNLHLSQDVFQTLEQIAEDTGASRGNVIQQALFLMKVAHQAKRDNLHIGLVKDASNLDTEIIGVL